MPEEFLQEKAQNEPKNTSGIPGNFPKKSIISRIILVKTLFFVVFCALVVYEIYLPHTQFTGTKQVSIAQGLGSRKIAELLKNEGVIRSKWAFVTYVSLKGISSSLKPGEYEFNKDSSIPIIADMLMKGSSREISITIPEGWSNKDIMSYLAGLPMSGKEEGAELLFEDVPRFASRFEVLRDIPFGRTLEGFLFPDTYRIYRDSSYEQIIIRMLENFERKITPDMREEAARRGKNLFEIVTMASLIEREVRTEEDMAIVSGILWKRLEIGMPLQVDATIIYLTGKRSTRVSLEETKIDSPYNTYVNKGLPYGPISNPGIMAIRAAIYPKESPYLFYLSTPEGETIFSSTLDEHNLAKARHLR